MPAPDERCIDLHTHTTASDGDQSPAQLVALAKEKGLAAIAVTDHDTTDGVAAAVEAGARLGVLVVPGIELSADIERGQCHILGLGIDPHNAPLQTRLRDIQHRRANRNAQMVQKLNKHLNIDLTLEYVQAFAGGDIVARPHFAKALIARGLVSSVGEAFDRYLGEGRPGHVAKARVSQQEAIALIHQAGGVAILAHPNNLKRDSDALTEAYIVGMKEWGLDGIEARYNLHTSEDNARYLALAARHDLLTSGGSDFHGLSVKPKVFLGEVEGRIAAPYGLLASLRATV